MIALVAFGLLLPAAFVAYRHSPLLARALWFAFGIAGIYLALAHAYPLRWADGDFEWLRWVSAATGIAGAWELGARAKARYPYARKYVNDLGIIGSRARAPDFAALGLWGRTDILAALFLGSMAADGVSALLERAGHPWGPMPVFQVAGLLLVILVSLWPSKWPPAKGWW